MSRTQYRAMREADRRQKAEEKAAEETAKFWPELCQRIANGQVIPIVSNAISNDLIFASLMEPEQDADPAEVNPLGWNVEDLLADDWATEVKFPLPDQHWLPRVALYVRVALSGSGLEAKMKYLDFLKESLFTLAKSEGVADERTLEDRFNERSKFSDIAEELGYLTSNGSEANPLDLLAKLMLPIYITTSHFNFLEQAIRAHDREPRTQICFWNGEPTVWADPSHKTDKNFEPTVANPLVYHVFGLESYTDSMVLNEDDYLDFLGTLARDSGSSNLIMPPYLQQAIAKSSLLLLGYRLRDWEFRVMFRGLIRQSTLRDFNLAIQMDLRQQSGRASADQIKAYLEKYFGSSNFTVSWDTPQAFMTKLWNEWQEWRK